MTITVKIKHDMEKYDRNIKVTGPAMNDSIIHPGEEKIFHIWKGADLHLEETEDG